MTTTRTNAGVLAAGPELRPEALDAVVLGIESVLAVDEEGEARVFLDAVGFALALRRRGIRVAAVSSSRNAASVLESLDLDDVFDATVDGDDLAALGLPGGPDPAAFLEAARRLGAAPARTAAVAAALPGVEAAARSGLALVVGVARQEGAAALRKHGAGLVVPQLRELRLAGPPVSLRSALDAFDEIAAAVAPSGLALFLDYDGTLSPIAETPERAGLPEVTRARLVEAAAAHPTAIVSGRDLGDVRRHVGLDSLYYAGCHGLDVEGPGGVVHVQAEAERALPALDRAESELREALAGVGGSLVERKRFAIAVHYRLVARSEVARVEHEVARVHERSGALRLRGGKEVFELLPDVDWGKGRALAWLLGEAGLGGGSAVPVFVGDDLTDEDGFYAVRTTGIGIRVGAEETWTLARYALRDTDEVATLLGLLAALPPAG